MRSARDPLLPASAQRALLAAIRERLKRDRALVVAIDGAAGLGKTTLAREIQAAFPDVSTVLHTDDYLTERHVRFAQHLTAYDPRAIDTDTLARDIRTLLDRRDITVRHYLHPTGTHGKPTIVTSRPLLIIEGGHALNPELLHLARPIGVFIDGTERAMYELRCERDVRERNASPGVFATWWPKMHEDYQRYVRPNREHADLVINRNLAGPIIDVRNTLTSTRHSAFKAPPPDSIEPPQHVTLNSSII